MLRNRRHNTTLTWKDVEWLRSLAPEVPIVVKGVGAWEDVELARKAGADAVVLSNHGGRQLDLYVRLVFILDHAYGNTGKVLMQQCSCTDPDAIRYPPPLSPDTARRQVPGVCRWRYPAWD